MHRVSLPGSEQQKSRKRIVNAVSDQLTIIYLPAEEGVYTALIPEVPGAISEGEKIDEARDMVIDALRELTLYRRSAALASRAEGSIVESLATLV